MELEDSAVRSWDLLARRHRVDTKTFIHAVGLYLLDFEEIHGSDLHAVAALAREIAEGDSPLDLG